ncbi:ABC-2 transporter permease [Bacillus shivajii]|uniref:ABC-2 transporter permease n=1 Tax=Bacillus shivajii TaxID=1983719 RepID=UPI001CFBCE31|nr:ABC-2 transporter permease [Bacillus shivajii]UCZ54398.1 ABC-2 transporter permease [Bacillus shivajii]
MKALLLHDLNRLTRRRGALVTSIILAVAYVAFTIATGDITRSNSYMSIPAFVIAVMSFHFINLLLAEEEQDRVLNRMKQLPISDVKLVLARYCSVIVFLSGYITVILLILFLPVIVIGEGSLLMNQLTPLYIMLQAVTLIMVIYIPIYYGFGRGPIGWVIIFIVFFWYMYIIIAPQMYYNESYLVLGSYIFEPFALGLLLLMVLLIPFSVYTATLVYREKRLNKKRWSIALILLGVTFMFVTGPLVGEKLIERQFINVIESIEFVSLEVEPIRDDSDFGHHSISYDFIIRVPEESFIRELFHYDLRGSVLPFHPSHDQGQDKFNTGSWFRVDEQKRGDGYLYFVRSFRENVIGSKEKFEEYLLEIDENQVFVKVQSRVLQKEVTLPLSDS